MVKVDRRISTVVNIAASLGRILGSETRIESTANAGLIRSMLIQSTASSTLNFNPIENIGANIVMAERIANRSDRADLT